MYIYTVEFYNICRCRSIYLHMMVLYKKFQHSCQHLNLCIMCLDCVCLLQKDMMKLVAQEAVGHYVLWHMWFSRLYLDGPCDWLSDRQLLSLLHVITTVS